MKNWVLLISLGLSAVPNPCFAESIWDKRDPRGGFLFNDNRARRVGDLLTITISESTATNEREQRAMDKSSDARLRSDFNGSTTSSSPSKDVSLAGTLGLDVRNRSNRTFNGSAQLTVGRTFTDKMAVTVVDTMPNGNLIVEGYRSRVIAGEERMLRITGIVRPADIANQNTVRSEFVANFRVSYTGRGPESQFVNQGYWSRVMNLLWPW